MRQRAPLLGAALLLAVAGAILTLAPADAQIGGTVDRMAADVVTTGNEATVIGPLDGCVRVEVGATFDVDIVVDSVPADHPMIAFQYQVSYDPGLMEVTSVNSSFLLAAVGRYEPFLAFQDPFPDTDGNLRIGILDTASNDPAGANVESGAGVLTRITFLAKAAGAGVVIPHWDPADTETYPVILDLQNLNQQVNHVQGGIVSVGADCPGTGAAPGTPAPPVDQPIPPFEELFTPGPGGPTPTPTPTLPPGQTPGPSGSPGGSRTPAASGSPGVPTVPGSGSDDGGGGGSGLVIAAVALGVLGLGGVGAGVWYARKRRQEAGAADE
jgi:hypothetical protein